MIKIIIMQFGIHLTESLQKTCTGQTPAHITGTSYTPLVCMAVRRTETPVQPNVTACNLQVYSPNPSSFSVLKNSKTQQHCLRFRTGTLSSQVSVDWKCPDRNSFQLNSMSLAQTPQVGQLLIQTSGLEADLTCMTYRERHSGKKPAVTIFFHVF